MYMVTVYLATQAWFQHTALPCLLSLLLAHYHVDLILHSLLLVVMEETKIKK